VNVRIMGSGALATLLTGLLAAEGHQVVLATDPENARRLRGKDIRVILTSGWRRSAGFRLGSPPARSEELGIVALPAARLKEVVRKPPALRERFGTSTSNLLLLDCDPEDREALTPAGSTALLGLSLLSTFELEPGEVEVASPRPWFVLQKSTLLKELRQFLKACGFEVLEVDDIVPYANSRFLLRLLYLPVAMCHSTLRHFLSYPEGREIALQVLEEGRRTLEKQAAELKKLPVSDPQELMQRLERKGEEFSRFRHSPDREYGPLLQSLLKGQRGEVKQLNEKLVRMASHVGVDPRWNWRLARKLSRVLQVGFYRDPPELYKALS
jgi:ketopantoate reductase